MGAMDTPERERTVTHLMPYTHGEKGLVWQALDVLGSRECLETPDAAGHRNTLGHGYPPAIRGRCAPAEQKLRCNRSGRRHREPAASGGFCEVSTMRQRTFCLKTLVPLLLSAVAIAGEDEAARNALRIVSQHQGVFTAPPKLVPTDTVVDGPVLGNGDVGVAMAGPPERQSWRIGKNDFWSFSRRCVITVGGLTMDAAAFAGASYRQEQDLLNAEVRGAFATGDVKLMTRSWAAATENLLVIELSCAGKPVEISLASLAGPFGAAAGGRIRASKNPVNIGREQYGGGRWYFHGLLDDVRIYDRALSADEISALAAGKDVPSGLAKRWDFDDGDAEGKVGKAKAFDGKTTWVDGGSPAVKNAVTIAAWIRPASFQPSGHASYIVSKGEWNQAYSLGLSADKLRMAVGGEFAQTPKPLKLNEWQHVAGTFDGSAIRVFVDGKEVKGAASEVAGTATAGSEGAIAWFTRRGDPAGVEKSRTVAVATRVLGAEATAGGEGAIRFTLQPGQKTVAVSAILSDLDAKEPLAAARKRVGGLTADDIATLNQQHRAWWRGFCSRSFIEIGDPLIERFWFGSHYLMASCSRAGKVPPGLFGNWITTDHPAWAGDFHLNYNHEAPFWGLYSSNHVDTASCYETPILEYLPQAKENAQKLLKCRGVYYPVGLGPWGIASGGVFLGQKSNAAYAATNMVMRFYSTYDLDYAKTVAYPFLREVGDFWEDYLKLENSRYVDHDDAIHEGCTPKDVNPLLSLGLIRMVFRGLLDMSKELGIDEGRRAKWQDVLNHLSDYPLQETQGKTVFRYSEKGQAWFDSNTLGIQHIWPAGAIGLDSDPKLLEVARNTHAVLGRWSDFNGFPTYYTAAARIGIDPKLILRNLREQCERHSYPNLFIFHGGGGIECCSAVPTCINEMLLQSHERVLRLFPCWPKDSPARFGNLRAYGAFLVSAELKAGQVQPVRITSEKGRDCTVLNPWPGRGIRLLRDGKGEETLRGERVTFKTQPDETLTLSPAE